MGETIKGTCLCGSVSVSAVPNSKTMDACHCAMCRKWSAGPYMAIACGSNVTIEGEGATAFRSSEWAERVFCNKCGTLIAWQLADGAGECHVNAQLFGESAGFPFSLEMFIDEKPDNYSFSQQTKTLTGQEIFAMFSEAGESGQ